MGRASLMSRILIWNGRRRRTMGSAGPEGLESRSQRTRAAGRFRLRPIRRAPPWACSFRSSRRSDRYPGFDHSSGTSFGAIRWKAEAGWGWSRDPEGSAPALPSSPSR
jgi:hypothetical protein